ncbi:MAG: hypothetical protein EXQ57_01650 [Bryobacterales bacterium]|nr:hypothetical protein [Bryobacterales bacterium]
MAETTLLKEQLTPEMIDIGSRLTDALDQLGVPIVASFWLFESESNDWLLRIASAGNQPGGPRGVYEKIAEARKAIGMSSADFPLAHVSIIDSNDKLVLGLQEVFKDGPATTPKRWGRGVIHKSYVDDAYIYRVNQPAAPSPSN